MIKLFLSLFLILISGTSFSQNDFITTWKTDNPGTSNSSSITIPTTGTGYNYNVDWNDDGTYDEFGITGDVMHDFGTAGTYTIRIDGNFPRIDSYFAGDRLKLLSVDQWGNNPWTSMMDAFATCENLHIYASDAPNLSNCTSMYFMFDNCYVMNEDLSGWDVSTITNFASTFSQCSSFNQPLDTWDVSNATVFQYMFRNATNFNQDVSNWDVSSALTMNNMFNGAQSFNNDISSWNVGGVTNMLAMFYGALSFDQNLGAWDVSSLLNATNMFANMTLSTSNYDSLLIGWSGQVLNSGVVFSGGNSMYCSGDSHRADMIGTDSWVITDGGTACTTSDFVTTWKTDNPGISNSTSITIPTTGTGYLYNVDWNNDGIYDEFGLTGDVTHDFGTAGTYTIRISGDFPRICFQIFTPTDDEKILSVDQWGTNPWTSMFDAFNGCENLHIYASDVPNLSNCTTLEFMFDVCKVMNEDLSGWDVSTITVFEGVFRSCTAFNQPLNSWDVSNGTDFSSMFHYASSFNQNLNDWDVSSGTTMWGIFDASNFNNNLSSWNVSNVTVMRAAFRDSPFNQDISAWDVSSVTTMREMFKDATNFNQDISAWDVSSVTTMFEIFRNSTNFNQDISAWDVSNVTTMSGMFRDAINFDQNLAAWNISSLTFGSYMFDGVTLSTENYDALLTGWSAQAHQSGVTFSGGNSKFCSGFSDRSDMINSDGWTITDGGMDCTGLDFITTWKTDNLGVSGSTEITIPTTGTGYNYNVDWNNDGIYDEFGLTGDVTHDFGTAGTYTIRISGDFPRINFAFVGSFDNEKILSVDQWGSNPWTSMNQAFVFCSNLHINATDSPNLSNCSDLLGMFGYCDVMNEDLSAWDVSTITTFQAMFNNCIAFDQPIGTWDISNAQTLVYMFSGASVFNQDISNWNVGNVTEMTEMFKNAFDFDQNLGIWDVSSLTNATNMFIGATLSTANYDALLSGWNSQTLQSGTPFSGGNSNYCNAASARANLIASDNWLISDAGSDCAGQEFITTWKTDNTGVSASAEITIPTSGTGYDYNIDWDNDGIFDQFNVTGDVTHDFGAPGTYTIRIAGDFPRIYFNNAGDRLKLLSIDQWGTISWTSMNSAFSGCQNLELFATDVPDLSGVNSLRQMFQNINGFNTNLNSWDVSTITSMLGTFHNCSSFDQPLNNWDVGNVNDMNYMFSGADAFNQDLSSWDVSTVVGMFHMFRSADSFDQDLSNWDVSSVNQMDEMFRYITLSTSNYDAILIAWNALNLQPGNSFHGGNSQYCDGGIARANMIASDGWSITDGGAETIAPTPDLVTLLDVNSECELSSLPTPSATDNCSPLVLVTSDAIFPITEGTTVVTWTYTDGHGNSTTQLQNVIIEDTTAPTPDVANLPDVTAACDVNLIAIPTGTDNCSGVVNVTNDIVFPMTEGTTVVTWTYEDEHGNTSTQTQNVIVDDVTAPIPDLATLLDSIATCDVISLTDPSATDECATMVSVSSDAIFPITEGTTVITWTYDDGHGNTSTQMQNVIVDDVTDPIPDSVLLADYIADCAAIPTAPTATDECSPIVMVSSNVSFPIYAQGTTVITWTYDDGNGNTTTQTQNVIVDDVTPPTASNPLGITVQCYGDIPAPNPAVVTDDSDNCTFNTIAWVSDSSDGLSCPETITRSYSVTDESGNFIQVAQMIVVEDISAPIIDVANLIAEEGFCDITLTAPTATDNCTGTITATADVTFPINTLGTTTVTWTYTDDCGNTSSQTQDVTINAIDVSTFMASDNITIVANNFALGSGVTYQWIDCLSGQALAGETNHNFTPTYGSNYAVIVTEEGCSDTSACVNSVVGIGEVSIQTMNLYPNPTQGLFTIDYDGVINSIELFDMLGRTVNVPILIEDGSVDAASLSPGKYLVRIQTENHRVLNEIIVIN